MSEDCDDYPTKWIECSSCHRLYWHDSVCSCHRQELPSRTNYDELVITKKDAQMLTGMLISIEGMTIKEDNDESRKA